MEGVCVCVCVLPPARGARTSQASTQARMLTLLCGGGVDAFPSAEARAIHATSLAQLKHVVADVAHTLGEHEQDPQWVQEKLMLPRINVAVDGDKCQHMQLASEIFADSPRVWNTTEPHTRFVWSTPEMLRARLPLPPSKYGIPDGKGAHRVMVPSTAHWVEGCNLRKGTVFVPDDCLMPDMFPGMFVAGDGKLPRMPHYSSVEVMRFFRVDEPRAEEDQSNVGQVFYYHAPGSGIYLDLGRTLWAKPIPYYENTTPYSCSAVRGEYDTMVFQREQPNPSSVAYGGMVEIVDCRGEGGPVRASLRAGPGSTIKDDFDQMEAFETTLIATTEELVLPLKGLRLQAKYQQNRPGAWEHACPPPSIARFLSVQQDGKRRRCVCNMDFKYLNCFGNGAPQPLPANRLQESLAASIPKNFLYGYYRKPCEQYFDTYPTGVTMQASVSQSRVMPQFKRSVPHPDLGDELVSRLNRAWAEARPHDDVRRAGVLTHILDGGGTTCEGFNTTDGLPPSGLEMWQSAMKPESFMSASMIGWPYPETYNVLNIPHVVSAGYGWLPGVVLDGEQAMRTFTCCYPTDAATLLDGGANGCMSGHLTPISSLSECLGQASKVPEWVHEECNCKADPSSLLEADRPGCDNDAPGYCWAAYNEVVLGSPATTSRAPHAIALFIAAEANSRGVALARSVHAAARASSGVDLPLLSYNRSATTEPFKLLPRSIGAEVTPQGRRRTVEQCTMGLKRTRSS